MPAIQCQPRYQYVASGAMRVGELRERPERAFEAYGEPLENVMEF